VGISLQCGIHNQKILICKYTCNWLLSKTMESATSTHTTLIIIN